MNVLDVFGALLHPRRPEPDSRVGALDLAPHQVQAVQALVDCASCFGGALLADAVGMGKTRVCLAVASRLAQQARIEKRRGPVWFVVPARLVEQWRERATRAGLRDEAVEFVTHTAMSRGKLPERRPAVVVVDEAHHFRNPRARRYAALADVASEAPVVLATATPVANHLGDLASLLRLFLGESDLRPWVGVDLDEAFRERGPALERLLERVVVRRTRWDDDAVRRPRARLKLLEYLPEPDEAWVWANLGNALARLDLVLLDGDWPAGLFVEHALRLWESGPRALAGTLEKLVDFHERWLEASAHGTTISRVGFRDLFETQPDQSVFAFMFDQVESADRPCSTEAVRADLATLRELLERVRRAARHVGREQAMVRLLQGDPGKLLVFTSFREAARSTFEAIVEGLGPDARVGLVTGDGARATGLGRASADDVVRRFSPGAFGLELPEHQCLDVLVATDCIAEGVDLHDCGRIVLADLPYSPLKVEQRIGRLLRPGSSHREVTVHLPRPENWNDTLGMRRRLAGKLDDAADANTPYETMRESAGRNPLDVLTRRDAWRRRLPLVDAEPAEQMVVATPGVDALWVVAVLEDGIAEEIVLVRVDGDGVVEARWGELLFLVDELERCEAPARPGPVRSELLQAAMTTLRARVDKINASRLAPHPLAFGSVPARAYRAIAQWVDEVDADCDVDALRHRLLRAWPRGIERRIEAWIDVPWVGARAWHELPEHPQGRRVSIGRCHAVELRQ